MGTLGIALHFFEPRQGRAAVTPRFIWKLEEKRFSHAREELPVEEGLSCLDVNASTCIEMDLFIQ